METVAAPRGSISKGMAASIGVHLIVAAYVVFTFSHPQPLGPPTDLSRAIPISLEMFRPTPPPEPPKPQAPKEVVTTTAPEPEAQIAEAPVDPAPPAPPEQPASGTPSAPSYASLVAGIIERNKQYPREALQDMIEGVVQAYFVVNHQGHVIAYRIEKRSGSPVLDQEIVRLLKNVSFPPIPDDGGDPQRREFSLPIQFKIKR